ncbi:MAG: UDP-glucose 4-epimerase GalE [Deltaproteobacteria bacterium]|nr:UDP-glucose 4-epimerase GalE [Deltaproteobacteria bacterium]HCH63158.1 UDP-glucose 4-epimerase GalE [Deltaproteobacteria bacterium]
MNVLVTGGCGYIGSHLVIELLSEGFDVVVLDDLSTGQFDALARAELVAGRACRLVRGSVCDPAAVYEALDGVEVVCHLAAHKNVAASGRHPGRYFSNNVGGMSVLLEQMERRGTRRIINSSSAAVYGTRAVMPLQEDAPLKPDSPYGVTKLIGEQMLQQMAEHHDWSAVSLRYFNPAGAHPSGFIGEPMRNADSLVARALRALLDPSRPLTIYGSDYDTADGTCRRDFIHVADLTRAHRIAMSALKRPGHHVYNVGTGRSHSVREIVAECGAAAGRPVPQREGTRRPGDIPVAVADVGRFRSEHGFVARRGLCEMVSSAWDWASRAHTDRIGIRGSPDIESARLRAHAALGPHWSLGLTA